ncbi:MAG: hypothetical protein DUD32_10025 [Lactobacillus sp.]|nr:MAG: hypothetical protein DUD32_10025 [Lactobacillus sp.]
MEIVTNQQLQKTTEKYIFNHREEIQEMINKKIATAIKEGIAEAFNKYSGSVNDQIKKLVQDKISEITASVHIDTEQLRLRLQKRVEQQIKKADIEIKL